MPEPCFGYCIPAEATWAVAGILSNTETRDSDRKHPHEKQARQNRNTAGAGKEAVMRRKTTMAMSVLLAAVLAFPFAGVHAEDAPQDTLLYEEDPYDTEIEVGDPEPEDSLSEETEADDGDVIEILSDDDSAITILNSDNAVSYDDDDDGGDDDDDDEDETENGRDPEEIKKVIVSNVNFNLQAGAKPKYTAEVTLGNAEILYEGWSDNHGNANYSNNSGYRDNDVRFIRFTNGELYWYHLAITAKGDDYFTGNTKFIINGTELMGKFNSVMTVCAFDKIFTGMAECVHQYKVYRTEPTCTQNGTEYSKCSLCGKEINARTIPALGHKYVLDEDKSVPASCTTSGLEVYECQNEDCGDVYRNRILPLGHHMAYEIEEPATGKKEGTYTAVCTRDDCGYSEKTRTIFPFKKIILSKSTFGYTGSAIKPSFRVTDSLGRTIDPRYYNVVYYGNKNIGTGTVHVTFSGMYSGKLTKTFKIVKGSQKISAKASTVTVPATDAKKKAVKFNLGAKAKTKLSYKTGSKKISVSSKGTVTVKKGAKKGTYTVTVTAKGTKNWKKTSKKIKIKVK